MSVKGQQQLQIKCLYGYIPDEVFDKLPVIIDEYKINTRNKLAHFLGQLKVETNFQKKSENLKYSVNGLNKYFRKYFKNKKEMEQYAGNEEKIANRVYANRGGNGNEASGDGYKFRGHGYIQLTFKDMYEKFQKTVDKNILENPDLVTTEYPLESSAWYFQNIVGELSNLPLTSYNIRKVTKKINSGLVAFDKRRQWTQMYGAMLDCAYSGKDAYMRTEKRNKYRARREFR